MSKNTPQAPKKEEAPAAEVVVAPVVDATVVDTAEAPAALEGLQDADDNGLSPTVETPPEVKVNLADDGTTKFVTTDVIRVNGGTMRDPDTNITYTRGIPTYGNAYEGSWLEVQIQAGFIKPYEA